jgi:CheY-like chemotaxis protein
MTLRVAVVDDEELVCDVLSIMVERLGHSVECTAHDGEELIAKLKSGKEPDLILMDFRMPGMGGIETAKVVRRLNPKTKVVIFSADDSAKDNATSEGFTFLLKPVTRATLASIIGPATLMP